MRQEAQAGRSGLFPVDNRGRYPWPVDKDRGNDGSACLAGRARAGAPETRAAPPGAAASHHQIPLRHRRRFVPRREFAAMSRSAPTLELEIFSADQEAAV
jgi:hypothetical protein